MSDIGAGDQPVFFLTVLILIGLIVIVIYRTETDPFRDIAFAVEQPDSGDNNDNPIYALYLQNCATCHGRAGQGQSGFPSLQRTQLDVNQIKLLITTGRGQMPSFPNIAEPHLTQLAQLVKQFSSQ